MSLHILHPNPSLYVVRQRQLHPFIKPRPAPTTYGEAMKGTVASLQDLKRFFDWFFHIAGFQPGPPVSAAASSPVSGASLVMTPASLFKKSPTDTYKWEYNKFPPHLKTIPSDESVDSFQIFIFKRLYDTAVLMFHLPLIDINGVYNLGPDGATSMAALEARNRDLHKAQGTDDMFTPENVGLHSDWYTDAIFGQQWFTGTNPTTIAQASSYWMGMFDDAAASQGNEGVRKLFASAGSKAFYVLDYTGLRAAAGIKSGDAITSSGRRPRFGVESVALFYLSPKGQLHPLSIIVDWKGNLANSPCVLFNKRVLPTDPTDGEGEDWAWRYAKTCVQVCDWAHHELSVHLTNTHFIEETIIVAANRTFSTDHVVYRLLSEHWQTTLSINALARSTLVPKVIVPLAPVTESQVYKLINKMYEDFNFTGQYVPTDLANRGFPVSELDTNTKYHNYGYGRDILRMWNTLRKFVANVLTDPIYYGGHNSDSKVAGDAQIRAFCAEMQSSKGAKMSSFPTVRTLDGLIDMVTMCIHIASGQHTAINYLQQYYMTFVPNKPSALFTAPPKTLAELKTYTEKDLFNALPARHEFQTEWLLMAQVPYLLSPEVEGAINLPTFARLSAISDDPVISKAGKTLQSDLVSLTDELTKVARQIDSGTKTYDVLYPESTARAIVI